MKRFTKILFQGTEPLNASEFEAMNSGKSVFLKIVSTSLRQKFICFSVI